MFNSPPVVQPAAQPPQPQPQPATQPATVAQPDASQPPALATAAPPIAVGADQKSQKIMEAMMTSTIGSKRNDLLIGTGLYLIKSGIYKVTPMQGARLTSFSLYCIKGVDDGQSLTPVSPQYTGPREGETYEFAVFHDTKYPNILGSQYLQIASACLGWTPEQVKTFQETPEGQAFIADMVARIMCVDVQGQPVMENGEQVTSIISNQAIVEVTKKSQIKDKKVDGQPVYDAAQQKIQITVTNVYFNKRIWLDDTAAQNITEAELIKAFGSPEAAKTAYKMEAEYRQG